MNYVSLLSILWILIRENLVFAGTFCLCTLFFATLYALFSKKGSRNSPYITFTAIAIVVEASLAVVIDVLSIFFG